ncbi:MAG: response regulator transcription factor [Acidimicrobiales bacterium]
MAHVLVIDDDASLLRALRVGLEASGHRVSIANDGEHGINQAALSSPDVVILDIGLPDLDGLEVSRRIRQWSDVPIIVLSASGGDERKIAALDGGANDYVTKPFSMGELEARIRVALRSRVGDVTDDAPTTIVLGNLVVDLVHHEARHHDIRLELTAKEFDLLAFLARYAGRTCTYQMILRSVWGMGYDSDAQYVHAYVHRLRHKLNDESGSLIITSPGVGYSIQEIP